MRMTGHVDGERRPLLRLSLPDGNPILVLIDTGFDGFLAFSEPNAIASGVDYAPLFERDVLLTGRRRIRVAIGWIRVNWLGRDIEVDALVDLEDQSRTIDATEPVALIGTQLLSPATLTIDFRNGDVVLED